MTGLAFGYLLPTQEAAGGTAQAAGGGAQQLADLLDLGVRAERLGFEGVWVPDSPFQYGVPDPLLVLAALAARTERITLATGVLLAGLRQPAMLAQQLSSLDLLGDGRLRAGLGLGFPSAASESQFAAAGAAFATRVSRFEETIALMRALWSAPGEPVSFDGRQVSVRDVILSPAPVQRGGPPIWLAGAGAPAEKRVGRLGDGWLPYLPRPAAYAEGWQRVQEAASAAGRSEPPTPGLYLTIALDGAAATARRRLTKTVEGWYGRSFEQISSLQAMYAGTPEGLGAHLQPYIEAGLRYVVLRIADAPRSGLEAAAHAVSLLGAALSAGVPS